MVGGKIKTEEKENTVFQMSAHSLLLVLDCYFTNGREPAGKVPSALSHDWDGSCSDKLEVVEVTCEVLELGLILSPSFWNFVLGIQPLYHEAAQGATWGTEEPRN